MYVVSELKLYSVLNVTSGTELFCMLCCQSSPHPFVQDVDLFS